MINRKDRFELIAADRFVLHLLNGGTKTLCTQPDGSRRTAEHRSKHPGRPIEANEVLVAREDVRTPGASGRFFKAKFLTGPSAGAAVDVHTNHVWPFCPYTKGTHTEAEREARRQTAAAKEAGDETGNDDRESATTAP